VQTGAAQEGILGTDAGTSTAIDSSTALGTDTETDARAGAGLTPTVFAPGGGATQFDLPDNGSNAEEELQPLSSQTNSSTFDTEIASGEEVLFGSNSDDEGEGNGLYRDGYESLLR